MLFNLCASFLYFECTFHSTNPNVLFEPSVASTNHNIQYDTAKVINIESYCTNRWLKEAIWIRRKGNKIQNNNMGTQVENTLD